MNKSHEERLRASRTAGALGGSRDFHKLSHKYSISAEITNTIYGAAKSHIAAADSISTVNDTLRSISEGHFLSGLEKLDDKIEPCRTQPEIFELKWKKRLATIRGEFRLYYGEPRVDPDLLHPGFVAVLFHAKDTSGSPQDIEKKQDDVMQEAANRFEDTACVAAHWGHKRFNCPNCV